MARRLLLIVAFMLLLTGISGGFAPRVDRAVKPPDRAARDAPPAGVVRGALPADGVVHAEVGDLVELTVSADQPDSVTIEALGITEGVAPEAPAQLSLLADRPGTFAVVLTLSGERAGRLVVSER